MVYPFFLRIVILTVSAFLFASHVQASEKRGKDLFGLCQSCHGMKGEGRQDLKAPSIAGMQEWYVLNQLKGYRRGARGTHHLDEPGIRMRPMAKTLRESDLEIVASYVSKLPAQVNKPTLDGNALKGKNLYTPCVACHQANGAGMQAVNAPRLYNLDDWYMLSQLKHFKSMIRGGDPTKDPYGIVMTAQAAMLPDEQAMKDVIAYIRALKPKAQTTN